MLVDERTLLLSARVPRGRGRRRARARPGPDQDRAVRVGRRVEHRCLRAAGEAAARLGELRAAAGGLAGDGLRIFAAGSHPLSRPERAGDRPRGALPRVRRVRRRLGAAPGRQRPARPRRACRTRTTCFRALETSPAVAAGRARGLGELAVPRRPRDGDGVEPRGDARPAAAQRRAAGLPRLRGVGGVRRAHVGDRARPGLHEVLVGRAAASRASGRSRSACRTSRRRSRSPAGLIRARCRPSARGRARAAAPRSIRRRARSTSRTAGRHCAVRLRRGARPSERDAAAAGARACRELVERAAGRAELGSEPLLAGSTRPAGPSASSRSGAATGSRRCADLVERSLAWRRAEQTETLARERHPLRALRDAAGRRARGRRGPRGREREPDGSGDAARGTTT